MDEDEKQEYECLKLEGFSEKEARRLARSANNTVNSTRLRGPRTGDTRHGHGQPPILSDMYEVDLFDQTVPLTMDTRSDMEREADWLRSDRCRELLAFCTDIQRDVLVDLYGLDTGVPLSYRQVGERYGRSAEWVRKRRTQAINRVRRLLADPPKSADEKRALRNARRRAQHAALSVEEKRRRRGRQN